jgi:teichuronic acid biosynthesis glycosyltransferase TuaC
MEITIVCPDYPTKDHFRFTFVKELAIILTRLNNNITVVAPQSITKSLFRGEIITQKDYIESFEDGTSIRVIRPYLLSLGSLFLFRKINFILFKNAVYNGLNLINKTPDIIYAHFWVAGFSSLSFAKKYGLKIVVGSGEEIIDFHNYYQISNLNEILDEISHVIPVSSKTMREIQSKLFVPNSKMTIVANGYDNQKFFESIELRKRKRNELQIKESDTVFIFVGQFSERKGVDKLDKALKLINNDNYKIIYIGSGPIKPTYSNTIFIGSVPHQKINEYLNSADIFIFPSRNEGCPNSVIEAMGAGLPIIIPNLEYSRDILPDTYLGFIDLEDDCSLINTIKLFGSNTEIRSKTKEQINEIRNELTLTKRGKRINQILLKINE